MSSSSQLEQHAVTALRRLGRKTAGAPFVCRVLAGGLSGSVVLHVEQAGEEMVLKLTPPGGDRSMRERSRREAWFYCDLATLAPVRVPRVLGVDWSETEGAALLLAGYLPSPAPADWTEGDYVEVARQLGRLHATFANRTIAPQLPGWLRAKPAVTTAQCQAAARLWCALGERDELAETLGASFPGLARLMPHIPALDRRMPTTPTTLCHGDFHAGNLLGGPAGEWIWADWQEARLGPGVDDLAFFWQRAFTEVDTPPPYDAMVEAYATALMTGDGPRIERERIDRALLWTELRSWLVAWPEYLGYLSTAQVERVLRRIDLLIGRLDLENHR